MIQARTTSTEQTAALAAALAEMATSGDLIVLSGDLGAGKTAFAKGFGAALDVTELDATTFGVSGCSQKVTYKFVPTSGFVQDAKDRLEPSEQDPNGTEKGPPIDLGGTKEQPAPGSSASAVPSLAAV